MILDAVLIQELARVLAQSLESALVPALVLVGASTSNAVPLIAFRKRFGRPRDCVPGLVRGHFGVRSGSFGVRSELSEGGGAKI